MIDIAAIGRDHLAAQLAGKMKQATVDQWTVEGKPVEVFWKPLTGKEQKQIDEFSTNADRVAAMIKIRIRDESGKLIFGESSIASMLNDYDFEVLQAMAFLMVSDMGQKSFDERIADAAKE